MIRADGISGLAAARAPAVEVIVLDIAIPKLDGWQVLDAIRNDPAINTTPVLVLTAHIGNEHVTRAADGGADIFMTKPFQPDDLRQAVRALLEQHHQVPANQPGQSPRPLTR